MQAVEKVLPHSPQIPEMTLAKNQPEYIPLPIARVRYSNDAIGLISRYRLTFWERLRILFTGTLWIEQLTAGGLQPQRPTVFEPLTKADERYSDRQEKWLAAQRAEA
jgi:hypothetical protein